MTDFRKIAFCAMKVLTQIYLISEICGNNAEQQLIL